METMPFVSQIESADEPRAATISSSPDDARWVRNATLFWARRRLLLRLAGIALLVSSATAFLLPKQYQAIARLLPPQQTSGGAAMLAALSGRAGAATGLASLAGGLLGGHSTGALYVNLLRSGTVASHLMRRFELQHVYRKRYLQDTAKHLARNTTITEDNKSGIITLVVEDHNRQRARQLAQAYIDELNDIVAQVNTSSAHREREFIEQRLTTVRLGLQQAQVDLSNFSSQHDALDIKEQTKATVEATARLEGQLVAGESELSSLRQIYGPENARVRAAEARIGTFRHELQRVSGDATQSPTTSPGIDALPYPALRQLPALAVTWANLYREVRIQETVFEMLAAQDESARIEEAKSIPSVSVIDAPGLPEKKSGPHRLWIILLSTLGAVLLGSLFLLAEDWWSELSELDTRKVLALQIAAAMLGLYSRVRRRA